MAIAILIIIGSAVQDLSLLHWNHSVGTLEKVKKKKKAGVRFVPIPSLNRRMFAL